MKFHWFYYYFHCQCCGSDCVFLGDWSLPMLIFPLCDKSGGSIHFCERSPLFEFSHQWFDFNIWSLSWIFMDANCEREQRGCKRKKIWNLGKTCFMLSFRLYSLSMFWLLWVWLCRRKWQLLLGSLNQCNLVCLESLQR